MPKNNYTRSQLIEMDACTKCGLCADVCPAVTATGDHQLSGIYRLDYLKRTLRFPMNLLGKLLPDKYQINRFEFGETVFRCTLCARCEQVCPSGLKLCELWLSLRHDLKKDNAGPKKTNMILENLEESRNVFDEDNEERSEWVEDLPSVPDHGHIKEKAEIVFFTGCVSSYFPMVQSIPMAMVSIMEKAGLDFTLLGEEEWCCGFPLLGAGLKDKATEFIVHNTNAIQLKGAQKVVFSCPSCYKIWKKHYPKKFDIYHSTQVLRELIISKKLPLQALPLTVTYHDPCDLGRGCNEYSSSRDILRSIPELKFVEMEHSQEDSICCGGGGNLEMIDPNLVSNISKKRIDEAIKTGAEVIISSCQQCVRTLGGYVRKNKLPLKVMDITTLVEKAI